MDVAVYHPWLKEKGGAEKVVLEVARRSQHSITVYTLLYDRDNTFSEFEEVDVRELSSGKNPTNFIQNILYGFKSLTAKLPEHHDKLIISEAGLGSLIALRNDDLPIYCYCHTPLRAALPEFKKRYRDEVQLPLRPVFDIGIKVYNLLERIAWKKFEHVAANSKTTKQRIVEKELSKKEDITVLNPGADVDNEPGDFNNYFLYPSRFRRYKRQDLAIEAFKEASLEDFKLVLAGSAQENEFVKELEEMSSNLRNVDIRTDLSGEEWQELYKNAYAVLFLAEKEDWGIVPIEAGSYGKPVIAVNEGGPTESIIQNETGYLVDADKQKIAEKMSELASNREKAKSIGVKGRENAKKYSWENFAEKLDNILE